MRVKRKKKANWYYYYNAPFLNKNEEANISGILEFRDFELVGLPLDPMGWCGHFGFLGINIISINLKKSTFCANHIWILFFLSSFFYRRGPRSQFQDPKRKKSSRKLSIVSGGSIYYGYDSSDEEDQAFLKNEEAFSPTTSHEMVTLGKRFVKKVKKNFWRETIHRQSLFLKDTPRIMNLGLFGRERGFQWLMLSHKRLKSY